MTRERHPIAQEMPPDDLEGLRRYCFELQCHVAQLWDQVWWLSLTPEMRDHYRMTGGHTNPIRQFYFIS